MFHYRMQVARIWREIDMRPISLVPESILQQATMASLMWDVLGWGLMDPGHLLVLDQAPMWAVKTLYREWQKDSQITVDGILGLIDLIDQHGSAVEADLIDRGMRLRDFPSERHNWRDLWVFVTHVGVYSHTYAATSPKKAGWGRTEHLLAGLLDNVSWLQWAKTEDAQKGGEPPDLIVRPGVKGRDIRPGSKPRPAPISRIRQRAKLDVPKEDRPKDGSLARQRQIEKVFG